MRRALDLPAAHAALGDRVMALVRAHGPTAARTRVEATPGQS